MAMSRPQSISILLVATTSAALYGGAAIVFVPVLSFILLCYDATSHYSKEIQTETVMLCALLAPVIASTIGFVFGALMALAHNAFVNCQRGVTVEISELRKARVPSFGKAA